MFSRYLDNIAKEENLLYSQIVTYHTWHAVCESKCMHMSRCEIQSFGLFLIIV